MTTPTMGSQAINDLSRPLSVREWVITLLLLCIPFVNLILIIYWAVSSSSNLNRKNFCIAYLVLFLIMFIISIVLLIVAFVLGLFAEHAGTLHGALFGLTDLYG